MNQGNVLQRQSARVVIFDENGRVLLVRFAVVRQGADFVFWATPGGGLEPGEDPLTAARREIEEELGLQLQPIVPFHETHDRFEHESEMVDNIDFFFLGRCGSAEPRLGWRTEAERKAMRELRWWTADEIEASTETIFPPDLAVLVRRCVDAKA